MYLSHSLLRWLNDSCFLNHDSLGGFLVVAFHLLDYLESSQAVNYSSKNNIFVIQEAERSTGCHIELALICVVVPIVLAHTEQASFSMLSSERLVVEFPVVKG